MQFQGQIRKMITEMGIPVQYYWNFEDDFLVMSQLLNKKIKIKFDHFECLGCHQDLEIYRMGYCKNCFFTLPQASESIIRPELSKSHLGIEVRDLEWEKKFELQPHVVYLANTSSLKVGVTRNSQIPTRWIDQGASEAIIIAKTDNRYEAGMIEMVIAQHVADKTNYRQMLKNDIPIINLSLKAKELSKFVGKEQQQFLIDTDELYKIDYPVIEYPTKIKSFSLKKIPEIEYVLKGIKGQYLIFENGYVFNVRNHEGFYVKVEV